MPFWLSTDDVCNNYLQSIIKGHSIYNHNSMDRKENLSCLFKSFFHKITTKLSSESHQGLLALQEIKGIG